MLVGQRRVSLQDERGNIHTGNESVCQGIMGRKQSLARVFKERACSLEEK